MSDKLPVVTRDYNDNFSVKDLAYNKLGPKYFGDINVNNRNLGLTGFTLEQIANITEDSFNTASTLLKEAFAIRAEIPESIYSHAAIFQLSDLFARPSECEFVLIIKEEDVLNYGTLKNGFYSMRIDANTMIQVEDKSFVLDYDIIVKAQKHLDEWIFSAQYDIVFPSAITPDISPFIKLRRTGDGFIGLFILAKQFNREITYETIINNTKINYPVIDVPYGKQIAGFDVFYKAPKSSEYVQLVKRLMYTQPLTTPFCYYKLLDENSISISFSSKELCFQPEFNSELKIIVYTTNGSSGNFETYTGNNVVVIPYAENYEYNDNIFMVAHPLTASVNGVDKLGLDALQSLTVEGFSTAKALVTENDLALYFNNFKYRNGCEMIFIKKRDDIVERLFSAFAIMKKEDYIYPTNTLFIDSNTKEVDLNDKNNRYIIKPGHLFRYKGDSKDVVEMIPDTMAIDPAVKDDETLKEDFLFTNPFMIVVTRKPNLVGFYMNIVNQESILDYAEINNDVFIQFVVNKISIKRLITDRDRYHVSLTTIPSVTLDEQFVVIGEDVKMNRLRILISLKNDSGLDLGFIELTPTKFDEHSGAYTFEGYIQTDDYITSENTFKCLNAVKSPVNTHDYVFPPISDCEIGVYCFYQDRAKNINSNNIFTEIDPSLAGYVICNKYSNKSDKVTFIRPMNMMRSVVKFSKPDGSMDYLDMSLSSIPFIRYDIIHDVEKFSYFIQQLTSQYQYLASVISSINASNTTNDVRLTNNMNIDIKFYNTYGRSKNFVVGDNEEELDKVNMSIKFKVNTTSGRDFELLRDLRIFIKRFVETVNNKGSNDIFISNLIREIENNFPQVHHQRFLGINDYPTDIQTVRNVTEDLNTLTKDERRRFVPELLVVDLDDIKLFTYD